MCVYVCAVEAYLCEHLVFLACEWVYIAVSEHRERAGVDGF